MYVVVCAMVMLMAAIVMVTVGAMAMMAMAMSMAMLTPTMAMQASPLSALTPPSSHPPCTLHLWLKVSIAFCWGHLFVHLSWILKKLGAKSMQSAADVGPRTKEQSAPQKG